MSELNVLSGTALVYTMLAMWATQPSRACELAPEPSRRLYLDRQLDREHLTRDLEQVRRAARGYAGRHGGSESAARAVEECESRLAPLVAHRHAVPDAYVLEVLAKTR